MRSAALVAMLLVAAVLSGCAGPTPSPDESASAGAVASGAALAPSASAAATPPASAAAEGFSVPETCDGLIPGDLAASLAAQGMTAAEVEVYAEVPPGAPLPLYDYDSSTDPGVTMTNYLNCQWVGADQSITIFVGRVDSTSRPLLVSEFWSFDRRIDRTGPVVTFTSDGVIPGVGQAPAGHWVLRANSVIKVDIDPGSEAARQQAQSIADQVAATLRAD